MLTSWNDPLVILIAVLIAGLFATVWGAILAPKIDATSVKAIFVGVRTPPMVVAAARRLASAVIALVATTILAKLGAVETTSTFAGVAVATGGIVEVFWGLLDQWLKAGQNNENPPTVAGSGSGDPSR